jgi:lactoylglutathione lyase
MIRVYDLEQALGFFRLLGLVEMRRRDVPEGRFTLVFLATAPDEPQLELTHNWDQPEPYTSGRNFGHVAYEVDDIYALCSKLADAGVVIHRPPRDGHLALGRSPHGVSVELLQRGAALAPSVPWTSMPNVGSW